MQQVIARKRSAVVLTTVIVSIVGVEGQRELIVDEAAGSGSGRLRASARQGVPGRSVGSVSCTSQAIRNHLK